MKGKNPTAPAAVYLLFAFLFALQVLPRLSWDSLTNDEPSDIANGYYYWTKGDVASPHNHPPLGSALQALPLLGMGMKTLPFTGDVIDRGHFFIFNWNLDRLSAVTWATRSVSLLMGLLLGFLLWAATRGNLPLCAATLFFWALDPALLALSGLAKTDIVPALFFFLAVLAFERARREPTLARSIAAGAALALAFNAKFYCLVLVPVFLVLEFLSYRQKENLLFWKKRKTEIRDRWIHGAGSFLCATFLIFLPGTVLLPDHRQPFYYLFEKFRQDILFAQNPFPVFFMGTASLESHWYYLPVAFLLKEPLPLILCLSAGVILAWAGKIRLEAWKWVPALLFSLALLWTPNLGVRYLLPAFPFLFLIAGDSLVWIWKDSKHRWGPAAAGFLALWQAASVILNFPHVLSYFNELVPPGKKLHYLADSNLDWGQDQKRLAEEALGRGWKKVRLAYYGGIDPSAYGLPWEPWKADDLKGPQPGVVYAVNASFLQLAPLAYPPTKAIAESWIADAPPTGQVGDSWYYFEVPGQARPEERGPWLPSAPFLQYRGYVPFAPSP